MIEHVRRRVKAVLKWRARVTSFVGTWPMWVMALAIASTLMGIFVGGSHTPSQDDNHPLKANTDKQVSPTGGDSMGWTPGGAPRADVSLEKAHRAAFVPPKGDPGSTRDCPWADSVTSTLTTTVSADGSLVIASNLHVTATGVVPPHPPLDLKASLQRPEGASVFAACFIATMSELKSLEWSDGKMSADLDLEWHEDPLEPIGYTHNVVQAMLAGNHATLIVNLCEPHPEIGSGVRVICTVRAKNTVVVRVKPPIENLVSTPFPTNQETKDDYFDSSWQFQGPMPRLKVMLDAPATVLATSWLYWNRGETFGIPFKGSASIDYYYIADSSAIWLALIFTALLLRRKQVSKERLSYSRRLLLIVLAGLSLGFEVRSIESLDGLLSYGFVVIITWAILFAAVAPKRTIVRASWLPLLALAPILLLASPMRFGAEATNGLLVWFSLALILLVIATAWVLWRQIESLFSLANTAQPANVADLHGDRHDREIADDGVVADVDESGGGRAQSGAPHQKASIWPERYRKVVDCLMIAAFMFGIGFNIGEILRSPEVVAGLAQDLVWRTGLSFRRPLTGISLLLAISYLADYLISHPRRTILPSRRGGWAKVRWVRVGNRAAAAILAMILCLSAPWTSRFALDFIPVWVLQFGILWICFTLLSARTRVKESTQERNPRAYRLLQAAIGAAPEKEAAASPGGQGIRAFGSPVATQARDPKATSRLLILGSQRGRLENAKSSAQVASIIAVIPVVYLIWTALRHLGGSLSTSTGVLIVALLAVLEFARWVVSGFVFGYLYAKLPGRIGPVKALSFAAIWALSCVGPLVVAQISGSNLAQEAIYRSAQCALFSIVLAVLVDLKTVISAGGSWRDLRKVYDLQSYGEVAAAVMPAALLALTLGQLIHAGSGAQVADTLLNAITSVLKGPL
jgi:Family of unknown function (DUF6185)